MKKRRIAAFLLTMALAVSQLAGTHGLTVQAALTGGEAGDSTETDRKCTHADKAKVEEQEATCIKEGTKQHYYCKACDGYFWDEACKEVIEATDVIIPVRKDHNYADTDGNGKCDICGAHTHSYNQERVDGKYLKEEATCAKKAVYYKSCLCGEFSEQESETFEDGKLAAHTPVKDPAVEATCTTAGKTEGSHCSVCQTVIKAQEAVAKKAHSYKETITRATTTTDGKIVKKCTVCGAQASETVIYTPKTVKLSWTTKTYTGKSLKPTLTVTGSNKKVINKKYYTVSGLTKNQKNVGTYKVTVKFDSKYYKGIENKTLTFSIVPKATSLKKVKAAKKGFTVTWKKQDAQTSGYEIQYAANKNFKKASAKTVSGAKKTSVKITKLSAKKKYWVRIRTYKTVKGKKIYSSWSKAKTVTTKK